MIKKEYFKIPVIILVTGLAVILFYNAGYTSGTLNGMKLICDSDIVYYNFNTNLYQCNNETSNPIKQNIINNFEDIEQWH